MSSISLLLTSTIAFKNLKSDEMKPIACALQLVIPASAASMVQQECNCREKYFVLISTLSH